MHAAPLADILQMLEHTHDHSIPQSYILEKGPVGPLCISVGIYIIP